MLRRIFVTSITLCALAAAVWLAGDARSMSSGLTPAALAQTAPSAPPAEQPKVTERGVPGQPVPLKPGLATPGGQPPMQKLPILPKLQASPPPPAQKDQTPRPQPGAQPKRSPSLSETVNILRSLPGGPEVIANATQRGAPIPALAVIESLRPWAVTLSPQRPFIRGAEGRPLAELNLYSLFLDGSRGATYFIWGTGGDGRPSRTNGTGSAMFVVPRDGWYMLNFEIGFVHHNPQYYPYGSVTLRRSTCRSTPMRNDLVAHASSSPIYTFRLRTDGEYRRSLPQLVDLQAGCHNFMLVIDEGYVEFIEASITKLER
jgi:hypothetical protein